MAPYVSKLKGPESQGAAAAEHHILTSSRMTKNENMQNQEASLKMLAAVFLVRHTFHILGFSIHFLSREQLRSKYLM